jgi:hypothetical protein
VQELLHFRKIGACKADVHMLLPQVEECIQHIQANSKKLLEYQKQRQTAIWKLLEITVRYVYI